MFSFSAIRTMDERYREDLAVYSGTALRENQPGRGDHDDLLVHGIRHSKGFAMSSEVTNVCSKSDRYARARNARLIMSNIVPDMTSQAVKPYCIWYPDVATEDTYREPVRRYPEMRYQAGRACAVAGYKKLYDELDLLPDISIAEDARDNGHTDIFEAIVGQHVRYAVMDDYTRSVDLQNPRPGAYLNGDTAVRSSLQPHTTAEEIEAASEKEFALRCWPDHYFDIQEDANAGPYKWPLPGCADLQDGDIDLLHKPLPRDLPPLNKDILVLMAAWDGNIDRYARLRRPVTIPNEVSAVVRGAYHHTPFARWLETCVDEIFSCDSDNSLVRQACLARFIMDDDLSRIDSEVRGEDLPEFFWWPHFPHEETLRELAWRRPDLEHQVTLACVVGNYRALFLQISDRMKPTQQQWEAAILSPNHFYREHLEHRAKEEGVELHRGIDFNMRHGQPWPHESVWSKDYLRPNKELYRGDYALTMSVELVNTPDDHSEDWEEDWSPPEGNLLNYHMHLQMGAWQRLISATDRRRQEAKAKGEIRLYTTEEDRKRRTRPPPQPKFPKTSVIPG
ncbi:hypothetical protein CkaCkLH20_12181 [Colletotrichum karsti]|uniref:Uncharacterized protein n=1 Tax=Colletotrichum karsti TaxID=1095194 RepID=A0A9P6HU46_9PEZI|nr:uncharacterized protein CkaCkLH20_12181 [Colletotrichum karsti]KAF9870334.1 hypothetical protein CkaCkLH20_12181 [Colletotrichum karsti]